MTFTAAARAEEPDHANDVLEEIRQAIPRTTTICGKRVSAATWC